MTGVILFSHGSLLCGAGEQLEAHAARLRESGPHPVVEVGYLNYSSPTFFEAVEKCAKAGATDIIIAPFFLISGYFVQNGLPKVLEPARQAFPHLKFHIAPAFEDHSLLSDALLRCANEAVKSPHWRVVLHGAPRYCQRSQQCPLHERCQQADWKFADNSVEDSTTTITENAGYALLVMVHGSPSEKSNGPILRVVEMLRERGVFKDIEVGFMECNQPDIPTATDNLIARGAQKIVAVPYFLHAGKHVANDLPELLEAAQEKHGDVEFLLGDFLGREPLLTDVLAARIEEAKPIAP